MSASAPLASPSPATNSIPIKSLRGRWKIGLAILVLACVAQAILWTIWWDDRTHFMMSILFVWPAGLFLLLNWWMFFSGWSARVRFGSTAIGVVLVGVFFALFKPDRINGEMVPTRLTYRWGTKPEKSRTVANSVSSKPAAEGSEQNPTDTPLVAVPSDWPGFRGPRRDGVVLEASMRTDWTKNPPNEIWRHPVGKGWSSFAVVGDFVFTQEQRDQLECVTAYRLSNGEQLWVHSDMVLFSVTEFQGGSGPRATPQFDDGKIYALGATGILNCLDARTGKPHWTTDILKDAGQGDQPVANLPWGMAGSPLVTDQFVIVNPGGSSGHSVAAYDKSTGQLAWSNGKYPASYSSPVMSMLHGESVILLGVGTGLVAFDLTGKELWFFEWKNETLANCTLPVVLPDDSILFGTGYGVGTVRIDVKKDQDAWTVTKRWQTNRFRPKFNDFVVHERHVYGLDDGTLTCVDIESGKLKWKAGHYGYGQLLLVDKLLLILSEEGKVILVPATPTKPEELASFAALPDHSITWNHPVLVRGKLLVRNGDEAACFDVSNDDHGTSAEQ